ncbi:MAG: zf-HC2 domain-containing protein [Gemmatimonadales bacterium]
MIECEAMRDRMPDVAHGTATWTEAEAAHLAGCAECQLEARIVDAGMRLDAGVVVASDRVARELTDRLRVNGVDGRAVRALPWRGAVVGLLAAAAAAVLVLGVFRRQGTPPRVVGDTAAAVAMLPELQGLDEAQLQSVLQSFGPTAGDATPGVVPHLEDLTDAELEEILRSEGGQ